MATLTGTVEMVGVSISSIPGIGTERPETIAPKVISGLPVSFHIRMANAARMSKGSDTPMGCWGVMGHERLKLASGWGGLEDDNGNDGHKEVSCDLAS